MIGSFYTEIYNLLVSTIYGSMELNPDMTLTISLISTILSLLAVLAPILICAAVFVWILKRI